MRSSLFPPVKRYANRKSARARRSLSILLSAVLMALTLNSSTLWAQSNGNSPIRDAPALAVLQKSVAAMGGATAWNSIQDWTITGTAITRTTQTNSSFSWRGSGLEFRLEVDTAQTANVFVSGHGTPARIGNGAVSPINYHVARANPPYHLPGLRLQQELNNPRLTIQYVGPTTVQGNPATQVHISDDSDSVGSLVTPHDWYFDPISFLPLRVSFRLPSNDDAGDYMTGSFDFSQFQSVNAMLVPFQTTLSKDTGPVKVFTTSSVAFNSGLPASTFDPPTGGSQ